MIKNGLGGLVLVVIILESDNNKAKKIVKELYKKAESSTKGSIERKYVDSLLDWY